MTYATVAGLPMHSGTMRLPFSGEWRLEAELTSTSADDLAGTVEVSVGGQVFVGTVDAERVGVDAGGAVSVVVLGGAGQLDQDIPRQGYTNTTVGAVLKGIAAAAGETLSASVGQDVLATPLTRWTRTRGPARDALRQLAEHFGWSWRILQDGTLWLGAELWPESGLTDYVLELEEPKAARDELAVETLFPRPGESFRGRNVQSVRFDLDDTLRAVVEYQSASRLETKLRKAIERHAKPDFQRPWDAKVIKQNDDGTLELRLFDERIPHLSRVPYLAGAPGLTLKMNAGAYVAVEFLNGDPTRPVVTKYDRSGLGSIDVDGGTRGVARVDDEVDCGSLTFITTASKPTSFSLVYTPPGGAPLPPVEVALGTDPVAGPPRVSIEGVITSGTEKLRG